MTGDPGMPYSTADRLAEIRARAVAATPGPWKCLRPLQAVVMAALMAGGSPDESDETSTIGLMVGPERGAVALVSITTLAEYPDREDVGNDPLWSDADFIAESRADIPWLLDEIERLTAALQAAAP